MIQGIGDRYLAARRAHPIRWELIELVAGVSAVALAWSVAGETVGIVSAVLWGLVTILSLITTLARMRLERRKV